MTAGAKAKKQAAEAETNGYVDKSAFFDQVLPEKDLEVPGLGKVRIRGLSREKALAVAKMAEEKAGFDAQEREWLRWGLVEPELSYQDIERWQARAQSGQIGTVTDAIVELSGVEEGAEKAVYKSVP